MGEALDKSGRGFGRLGGTGWEHRGRRAGEIGLQSAKDFLVDSGPQWAAAIAYYTLLSSLPLLLVGLSIAAFVIDPQSAVDRLTELLGDFVPQEDKLNEIVTQAIQQRGQVGMLAFLGLLWTGTRVFSALTRALNISFDVESPYGFLHRLLLEAAMLLTIGLLFVAAISSGLVLDWIWGMLNLISADSRWLLEVIGLIIRLGLLFASFLLMYRYVPSDSPQWRSAVVGATVATLLFAIVAPLFQHYIARFGTYNVIYGSLAVVVIVLIWIWCISVIMLFGGEVAAHYQAMVIDGKSAEQVSREHAQRAPSKKERREGKGQLQI